MAFNYIKEEQNIVTITMDMGGRSTNVINEKFYRLFTETIEKLENEKDLTGVILTSAKKTFLAGGDIEMLFKLDDPKLTFDLIKKGKDRQRRLEHLGKPIVAAINGTALGGGLEIALCCNYRVVLNDPNIKIGFPEVTLGIMPGSGGIVRSIRLLGLEAALPFLMEGKQVNPETAKKVGFINDTADNQEELIAKAKKYILTNPEVCQPWNKKGYKI